MQAVIISAGDKMQGYVCYSRNWPALFLEISVKANQHFLTVEEVNTVTRYASALNRADLHQIWLPSQTGAVSSTAVFTSLQSWTWMYAQTYVVWSFSCLCGSPFSHFYRWELEAIYLSRGGGHLFTLSTLQVFIDVNTSPPQIHTSLDPLPR